MLLQYLCYQILSYGFWWILFLALTILLARLERRRFFVIIPLAIPILIYALDIQWIRSEMAKPEWDGMPDMDIAFAFGMLFRIVLMTTLLSVIYFVARIIFKRVRTSRETRAEQAGDGKPDHVLS